MKQQKWSGVKLSREEREEIKREERIELGASILIIVIAILFGILFCGFILEMLQ